MTNLERDNKNGKSVKLSNHHYQEINLEYKETSNGVRTITFKESH